MANTVSAAPPSPPLLAHRTPFPSHPSDALADALGHVQQACALLEAHRRCWVEAYSALARSGQMKSPQAARYAYLIQAAADAALTRTVLKAASDLSAEVQP